MEPSLILDEPAVRLRGEVVGKVAYIPTTSIPFGRPYPNIPHNPPCRRHD